MNLGKTKTKTKRSRNRRRKKKATKQPTTIEPITRVYFSEKDIIKGIEFKPSKVEVRTYSEIVPIGTPFTTDEEFEVHPYDTSMQGGLFSDEDWLNWAEVLEEYGVDQFHRDNIRLEVLTDKTQTKWEDEGGWYIPNDYIETTDVTQIQPLTNNPRYTILSDI